MLLLDKHLWHTKEEIEAAGQAEIQAAEEAAETARQRALYEDEVLLADVARMLDGDSTGYRPAIENGAYDQLVVVWTNREVEEADV